MMFLILRTLKDRKWTIIIYCLAVVLFLWMYIALFPSIVESFDSLKGYLANFPEGIMKAFGIDAESFVTFEGYIGSEQFTFIWPIMIIALSTSLSGQLLAGEVEKGTAEFLLAQPLSRIKLFFSKYLAGIIGIAIFVFVSILSVFPWVRIYNIVVKSDNFWILSLLGFSFALAVYSLSILFSAIFSEKGKANFAPVGILILMYVINMISSIQPNLEKIKYVSFFYYFNPSNALIHGNIDPLAWVVFLGSFLVFTSLAVYLFNKKDIAC